MPTFSFTVDNATGARIAVAIGNHQSLVNAQGAPWPATAAEVKQFLIRYLKEQVQNAEISEERAKIQVTTIVVT